MALNVDIVPLDLLGKPLVGDGGASVLRSIRYPKAMVDRQVKHPVAWIVLVYQNITRKIRRTSPILGSSFLGWMHALLAAYVAIVACIVRRARHGESGESRRPILGRPAGKTMAILGWVVCRVACKKDKPKIV